MNFATIEAFTFTDDEGDIYEEDRIEALDTTWCSSDNTELDEVVLLECKERLADTTALVVVAIRDSVEYDAEGEIVSYGECAFPTRYIWDNNTLTEVW